MSYVIAAPEMMAEAATDLATIGSTVRAAHLAAAPTVAVLPPAADEVSTGIAHLFSRYAQDFQKLAGHAAAFHEQIVQHLTGSAGSYAAAEAANVTLQQLLQNLTPIAGRIGSAIGALGKGLFNVTVADSIDWFKHLFQDFLQNPLGFIFDLPFIILGVAILFVLIGIGAALGLTDPTSILADFFAPGT
jgi:hypothetical protein